MNATIHSNHCISYSLPSCLGSQPLLKTLLPHLRESIHDASERVRGAMLDLLITVNAIHEMKASPRSIIDA